MMAVTEYKNNQILASQASIDHNIRSVYKHMNATTEASMSYQRFKEIYSPELERIQHDLVKKHGYVQESHKLDIFGLCPECANGYAKEGTQG